jgi:hypothetical protein
MSSKAASDLESIDRIAFSVRPDIWYQSLAVNYVDARRKHVLDEVDDTDILEHADGGVVRDLNHDVDIAIGSLLTPSDGTEQGGMCHPALTQGAFVFPQPVKDFLPVHVLIHITKAGGIRRQVAASIQQLIYTAIKGAIVSRKAFRGTLLWMIGSFSLQPSKSAARTFRYKKKPSTIGSDEGSEKSL